MFTHCARSLTRSLIDNKVIDETDLELYNFGFEMALAITANIITTFLIGLLFHMLLESLLFLAAFIPLRSYVGGFHASNHLRCYWLSVLAVIAVLFATRFVLSVYNAAIVILTGIIYAAIMFILVPVQDANRPLEDIEIRVYRWRARIVLCVEILVMTVFLLLEMKMAVSVLLCILCLACVSVCTGVIKNYFKPIN